MANTDETYRGKPEWVRRQRKSWHGVDGMYNRKISFDKNYRDYCTTLMALDDSIGQVHSALEDNGLLQSTLVVYLSDNGFQFGEHGLIDKRTMYESSIRIPLLAHCPDLFEPNQRVRGLALNIDVAPTLLDAAGVAPGRTMHGASLLPLLRGSTEWRKDFLYEYFWERAYPQTPSILGLRTDQYSYMNYHGVWDRDELYDIQVDPEQKNNLLAEAVIENQGGPVSAQIKDPMTKSLVQGFHTRIGQIMRATGGRPEPSWSA
jgi:N-acetylglucosamine-6-sulfatase